MEILGKHKFTTFVSEETEYTVAKFKDADGGMFTAVGIAIPCIPNCIVKMQGEWIEDKRYGAQFKVETADVVPPVTKQGVISYLSSLKVGIGEKVGAAIYDKFGEDTWHVIEEEPQKLLVIPRLNKENVRKLTAKLSETRVQREIMQLFLGIPDITAKKAKLMAEKLGPTAVEQLKQNPYAACRLVELGFLIADKMAKDVGLSPEHPDRLVSAFLYVLTMQEMRGHVCIPKNELISQAYRVLNQAYRPQEVVSKERVFTSVDAQTKKGILHCNGDFIYSKRRYKEEDNLAKDLIRIMRFPVKKKKEIERNFDKYMKEYTDAQGFEFAALQREAVYKGLTNPLSVITGGPGTGKTTITKALLYMEKKFYGEVADPVLLAPTGKAARRLSEASGYEASTVHSAIVSEMGAGVFDNDFNSEENFCPIPASHIIIDEASMLDQSTAQKLIRLVAYGCQVTFVGDPDQLPSVGAGNVLFELIRSKVVPVVKLDVIFRQASDNPIVANAKSIREGKTDLFYNNQFKFISANTEKEQLLEAVQMYLKCVKHYGIDNTILLNPYRSEKATKLNTNEFNRILQNIINPIKPNDLVIHGKNQTFHVKDRVMQLENRENVKNGDVGIIETAEYVQDEDSDKPKLVLSVNFGLDKENEEYTKEEIGQLDLAYCSTIHKSQGSEYQNVILVVSDSHTGLLKRNLVYTAITRSSDNVAIVGTKTALSYAIAHTEEDDIRKRLGKGPDELVLPRYTLLAERIYYAWQAQQPCESGDKSA